jgi:opacity protein-like surface antigen
MFAKSCVRVTAALMLAAASSNPAAAAPGGWYVIPSYHETGLNNANNKYTVPAGEVDFNSSFGDDTGAGLAAGYAFSAPYRVDVDFQKHSNDLKVPAGSSLRSSSLEATTYVANVWRDFGPWYNLRPYAGLGFGGGTMKFNDLNGNFYFGQLGIGVVWFFTKRAALDVGYRYQLATSNPELTGNSQKLTTEYTAQSLQIGIRINVWGF